MTTYICKCGKTFEKNTESSTTGFRMPDYGPDHECYGCPFVCKVTTWDPMTQHQAVQNHECRGSKAIRYDTTADINVNDKCTANIYTLDFDFLRQIHKFADSIDGFQPDRYFFDNRSAVYGSDGRYRYTLYPLQNKTGIGAKDALKARFFNTDGGRKDVTPEQEKEIVLNRIEKAKEEVQSMNAYYAPCGHKFSRSAGGVPEISVEVTGCTAGCFSCPNGLHEPETDEHGPRVMCVCSRKKVEPADTPITLEDADTGYPGGAEEMNELAGQADLVPDTAPAEQEENAPESGNEEADSADEADGTPASEDDTDESANDDAEQQPCDWKNASGGDDEGDDQDEEAPAEVTGDPISLRGHELDDIVSTADSALNKLIATLHAKKQRDGEMTVKITFEDDGFGQYIFGGTVSGKINYTIKPQKISGEPIELKFDAQGNPVVPADRQHQLNFDEIQPGQREIPPSGGTATVDGTTGIIEHYEVESQEEPPADESQKQEDAGDDVAPMESEPEEKLFPCKNYDCPFYGVPDDGTAGCCYDPRKDDAAKDATVAKDIEDAILFNNCCRDEVITAYAAAHPDEDEPLDQPPDHDGADDFPPFEDDESNKNLEDDAS